MSEEEKNIMRFTTPLTDEGTENLILAGERYREAGGKDPQGIVTSGFRRAFDSMKAFHNLKENNPIPTDCTDHSGTLTSLDTGLSYHMLPHQ